MKSRNVVPLGLWLGAIALTFGSVQVSRVPATDAAVQDQALLPPPTPLLDRTALPANTAGLRDRNPFRLARSPTARAFGVSDPSPTMATPDVDAVDPPPPLLRIGGIVGGPPWSAVVEGVPGHEAGLLIRAGEQLNGVHVLWVRADSVGVSAGDSTWVLTLKGLEH